MGGKVHPEREVGYFASRDGIPRSMARLLPTDPE